MCALGRRSPSRADKFDRLPYFNAQVSITTPLFLYKRKSNNVRLSRLAGAGSSAIAPPRSAGISPTSTVSTSPLSRKVWNSDPPPNNQMSLPGAFAKIAYHLFQVFRNDRDVRKVGRAQRLRENHNLPSGHRCVSRFRHALERLAPHQQRVVLREHRAKINFWIRNDPVVFAVRPRDVPIQAPRHAITYFPHPIAPPGSRSMARHEQRISQWRRGTAALCTVRSPQNRTTQTTHNNANATIPIPQNLVKWRGWTGTGLYPVFKEWHRRPP
jgi:hypothetical protein